MPDDVMIPAGWLTSAEAERLTGYNLDYLRRMAREGKVDARKVAGVLWIFERESLQNWQAAARPGPKRKRT